MYDYTIVGGGIVGLSTALALNQRHPTAKILLLEKETEWGMHQTGHNSGVIHSGIYYKPGSFKAKFAREGNRTMIAFCQQNEIPYEICGKLIIATEPTELPQLEKLYQNGLANQLHVEKIGPAELKEIEPHAYGIAGIRVHTAGIVDYQQVCKTIASLIAQNGCELRLQTKVLGMKDTATGVEILTTQGTFQSELLINCAGLHSDRIAQKSGVKTDMKVIPFRGEYYELKPEKRYLVKNLIYPVPNPKFPFLGVHFTRMIDGTVEAGPNAVLGFKREGYKKSDFDLKDFTEIISYPGFWTLAAAYWKEGLEEMLRSFHKTTFVKSLQKLVPEIQADDLIPNTAGVRAQALKPDGTLVDDFHIIQQKNHIHICNAPSPAATASLQIGQYIVDQIKTPVR